MARSEVLAGLNFTELALERALHYGHTADLYEHVVPDGKSGEYKVSQVEDIEAARKSAAPASDDVGPVLRSAPSSAGEEYINLGARFPREDGSWVENQDIFMPTVAELKRRYYKLRQYTGERK